MLTMKYSHNYEAWQQANREVFENYKGLYNGKYFVYLDLFHDNLDYILYSLHIGSIISKITGVRAVGITGKIGSVWSSCLNYDSDFIEVTANSYHVDVIHCEDVSHVGSAITWLSDVASRCDLDLQYLEGAKLRAFLRSAKLEDGFPIGRYIHDTYLRTTLKETIGPLDVDLIGHTARCLAFDAAIRQQFQKAPPAWLVVGHVDYSPWGILGQRALEAGGRIAYFRNEGNVRIHLVDSPMQADDTLSGHVRRHHSTVMNSHIDQLCQTLPNVVDRHFRASASSGRFRSHRFVPAPAADLLAGAKQKIQNFLRRQFCVQEGRPVIGVFSITFADIPYHDVQAFDDNYQWLSETLRFAAEQKDIDWLIRIHPADAVYNSTGAAERLKSEFADYPHIRFIDGHHSPSLVMMACDVVTTLRGSPGLQAASLGLPVVFAGRGQYSDFGFSYVEETPDAYFKRLIACATTPLFDRDCAMRARAFQFLEDVVFANVSSLLGPFGELEQAAGDPWETLVNRLRWYQIEKDPLYGATARAISCGAMRVGGEVLDTFSADRPAAVSANAQRFAIGTHWPENFVPLTGFHAIESWGVWTDGAPLAFLVRVDAPLFGTLRLEFTLTGKIPQEWPLPTIRALRVDGCHASPADSGDPDALAFETMPGVLGEDGYLLIELESDGGTIPSMAGNSTDQRKLVFSFESFAFELVVLLQVAEI